MTLKYSFYQNKRVLLTGGNGFIGGYLKKALAESGADLYTVDKEPGRISDQKSIHCDIGDAGSLDEAVKEISPHVVFHMAASIDRSSEFSGIRKMIDVNVIGSLNLFESLKEIPACQSIIVAGTSEELGQNPTPFDESQREDPVSPYSFSKVCVTHLSRMLYNIYQTPITVLRPTLAYGPGQDEVMFFPALIQTLLRGELFEMTSGEQTRDFVYIDDLVNAYLLAGARKEHSGEVINIGSGKPYKIREVARRIATAMGRDDLLRIGARPYRKAEIMSYFTNITKAQSYLGWSPSIDIDEGIEKTIACYVDAFRS